MLLSDKIHHVPQGGLRGLELDVYCLYNFKFFLLLLVVNIIHKCCKLVFVYHSRYIRHYLLTHSLYRMWYLVYHLCEVVCLMHNYLVYMYHMWYITYHMVVCHRTKLPSLKKQYSIPLTVKFAPHVTSILDCMFSNVLHVPYFVYKLNETVYIATVNPCYSSLIQQVVQYVIRHTN